MLQSKGESRAFVPASELGEIAGLPMVGRRFVVLALFQREGLKQLHNRSPFQSHMLTNRRLSGPHRASWVPHDRVCHGCGRAFGEIYGYSGPVAVENLGHILVVPKDDTANERFFCWSCGASRDTMIQACGTPFADYIAEDGRDVFAFIAQIVFEDLLADRPGHDALACHNNSFRVKRDYKLMIDGRLRTFQDRQ